MRGTRCEQPAPETFLERGTPGAGLRATAGLPPSLESFGGSYRYGRQNHEPAARIALSDVCRLGFMAASKSERAVYQIAFRHVKRPAVSSSSARRPGPGFFTPGWRVGGAWHARGRRPMRYVLER